MRTIMLRGLKVHIDERTIKYEKFLHPYLEERSFAYVFSTYAKNDNKGFSFDFINGCGFKHYVNGEEIYKGEKNETSKPKQ